MNKIQIIGTLIKEGGSQEVVACAVDYEYGRFLMEGESFNKWKAKCSFFIEKEYRNTELAKDYFIKAKKDEITKIDYLAMLGTIKALKEIEETMI